MNMEKAKFMLGRGHLLGKKYSPEILMGVGIVGVVSSTVMACKATLKVEDILDDAKERVELVKDSIEEANDLRKEPGNSQIDNPLYNYSEKDYKKDMTIVYVQTGVEFIKLYGPAISLGAVSVACLLGSHNIMRKRNLGLLAAYKAIESNFEKYRNRVVEELGEDKERLIRDNLREKTITTTDTDENGKKTKKKETVEEMNDPNGISEYARFYDDGCTQWSKDADYNLTFLKCQQNYANDLLHSRGHIFLNEVYDMLGIPRTKAGSVVGWVKGVGDDFVDFGIFKGEDVKKRDFVNGYERSILLDFNVSGVIYDLI